MTTTNINTQVALANVRTKKRFKNMTPAQIRRYKQMSRMTRYAQARKDSSPLYQQITNVIKQGGRHGADVQNVIDLMSATYGVNLSVTQVYAAVAYGRKVGTLKQFKSAYHAI